MKKFVLKVTRTVVQEAEITINADDEAAAVAAAKTMVKDSKYVTWKDRQEVAKSDPVVAA